MYTGQLPIYLPLYLWNIFVIAYRDIKEILSVLYHWDIVYAYCDITDLLGRFFFVVIWAYIPIYIDMNRNKA